MSKSTYELAKHKATTVGRAQHKAATVGRAQHKAATVGRAQRFGENRVVVRSTATTGRGFMG